jgi:hypothetical protein
MLLFRCVSILCGTLSRVVVGAAPALIQIDEVTGSWWSKLLQLPRLHDRTEPRRKPRPPGNESDQASYPSRFLPESEQTVKEAKLFGVFMTWH